MLSGATVASGRGPPILGVARRSQIQDRKRQLVWAWGVSRYPKLIVGLGQTNRSEQSLALEKTTLNLGLGQTNRSEESLLIWGHTHNTCIYIYVYSIYIYVWIFKVVDFPISYFLNFKCLILMSFQISDCMSFQIADFMNLQVSDFIIFPNYVEPGVAIPTQHWSENWS